MNQKETDSRTQRTDCAARGGAGGLGPGGQSTNTQDGGRAGPHHTTQGRGLGGQGTNTARGKSRVPPQNTGGYIQCPEINRSGKECERKRVCAKYIYAAAAAKSLQSCPTLCDPIDGSPPGSDVAGILQARTLEWVAISFSNA